MKEPDSQSQDLNLYQPFTIFETAFTCWNIHLLLAAPNDTAGKR